MSRMGSFANVPAESEAMKYLITSLVVLGCIVEALLAVIGCWPILLITLIVICWSPVAQRKARKA